jgi:hypothetical protein
MANRSRANRKSIPGYEEFRPSRLDRKRTHRATRHAANQMLHTIDDFDDVANFPEVRRSTRESERAEIDTQPTRGKFKVWKTKFWKRRDSYQEIKASLDANWNELPG